MTTKRRYDANDIEVLDGLEPVRKRPGMWIGGTGKEGMHHLVWELLDNAVDEAAAGHADRIEVDIHPRMIIVKDNGRGIPVGKHKSGVNSLDLVFTKLHAGGKFGGGAYKTAGGLHGVGSAVVNALSSSLEVEVARDGKRWTRRYERGAIKGRLSSKNSRKGAHGTKVTFQPDDQIFPLKMEFDADTIVERVKTKAHLTPGVLFLVRSYTHEYCEWEFQYDNGLEEWVKELLAEKKLTAVEGAVWTIEVEEPRITVSLCWVNEVVSIVKGFANGVYTPDGGTHILGLRSAVTSAIKLAEDAYGMALKKVPLTTEDVTEGFVCFVSVFIEDPQFQGQTKDKLNNPEVRKIVDQAVKQALSNELLANASTGKSIVTRCQQAAKVRTASRSAATAVRKKVTNTRKLLLPGKLADCSSDIVEETELFIVEGDSAGGSAKQGRDRHFQAILPIRGKILNTEDQLLSKVIKNNEVDLIIQALGCGIGPSFDLGKLRYGKVIIMCDADVDGHHIAVLLLTLFYRWMPELIFSGHVFLAQPPLYKVSTKKKTWWCANEAELDDICVNLRSPEIMRMKGLGELMPKDLWSTTMDPKKRRLQLVEVPPGEEIAAGAMLSALMGKDVESRASLLAEEIPDEVG